MASYKPPSMPDLEPVPVPVIAEAVRSPPILRVPQPAPERKLVKILLRLGVVALVVIALAGAVMGIGVMLERRAAEAERQQAAAQADTAPAPVDEKIADRLPSAQEGTDKNPSSAGTGASSGQPGDTSATIDADAAGPPQNPLVQQAFILAEPVSGTSEPVRYEGRVTWKLETLKSAITNTSDIGARAIIDIPDAGFALSLVFRQNRDPKAAFAHVIEANFSLSENNLNGKIRDINLPELRLSETVRGAPLLGIPVPVTDKMFLIGLNALPADIERNLDLLRTRNWFLIPIRYANGKRTVLLFEKGKAGERIMEDAIGTWK